MVRALRVAFADFSAAPWQGFEKSERGPSNSSLFQPLAAVVVVAVQVLLSAPKTSTHCVLVFLFVRGRGSRTRRRHLCRKQSHSAALLSLRVPTRRNVYQGCTHFVPVSFCAREGTSNNTIYYIKESAMNSENSSRLLLLCG